MLSKSPIVIVGMAARFAGANNIQEYWKRSMDGENMFAPVPVGRWANAHFYDENPRSRDKSYAPTGAWLDDVESFPALAYHLPPRRVEVMDPQQRLALELAYEALEDAGYTKDSLSKETGVYMGVTAVEYRTLSTARIVAQLMASGRFGKAPETDDDRRVLAEAVENVIATRPYTAPGVLANMVAATITQELNLHGPSFTTDAACASSLVALDSAVKALRDHSIDTALVGGVYLCLTPEHHVAFSRIGAISKSGVCRPFDAKADGFVQGDGGGVLMLKRLDDAQRDGDRIYAVLHGIGCNNDGGETGPMAPVKSGQIDVIQKAWRNAGIAPEALGYVECHGTGTAVGDVTELSGLREALQGGLGKAQVALGSSKANFGHTMSAAGVCGLIRATLSLYHECIPPMANFETPKAELPLQDSPFYIPQTAKAWTDKRRLACVSSFGFGGTNGHAVLGSLETLGLDNTEAQEVEALPELLFLSASSEVDLRKLAGDTALAMRQQKGLSLKALGRSLARKKPQKERLAFVAKDLHEAISSLEEFAAGGYPKDFYYAEAPSQAPKIGFMYPGQGAQRLGMLTDLKTRFPRISESLERLNEKSRLAMDKPMFDYLYPDLDGGKFSEGDALSALTATEVAQPVLFAVGVALTEALRELGLSPELVMGHSVGEFTAAAVSGLLSQEEGLLWCRRRGEAMVQHAEAIGDRGLMAAWRVDQEGAKPYLVKGARIANVNHPKQVVISGPKEAVLEANRLAEAAGIEVIPLRVSHGFHSEIFEGLDLSADVEALHFQEAEIPVVSCIIDEAYKAPEEAKEVFLKHASSPVEWVRALQKARDLGVGLLLQVSAGGPLRSFARASVPELPVVNLAGTDDHDGGLSFLSALGQLFVHGVELNWTALYGEGPLVSVPPTLWPREHYWVIRERAESPLQLYVEGGAKPSEAPKEGKKQESAAPRSEAKPFAAIEKESPKAPRKEEEKDALREILFAAVAEASAYPRQALKGHMKLGDDLGFDSMMVGDLIEALGKQIPGFSGLPQELLVKGPSIDELLSYLREEKGKDDESLDLRDSLPLSAYAPKWIPSALREMGPQRSPKRRFALLGEENEALREALLEDGQRESSLEEADLLLYLAGKGPELHDVLDGKAEALDESPALLQALKTRVKGKEHPDLLVLAPKDSLWAASLAGVVKSLAEEWPESQTKILYYDKLPSPSLLWAELQAEDRSLELYYTADGGRYVAGLQPVSDGEKEPLKASDVFLITGGSQGIGKLISEALVGRSHKVLSLSRHIPSAEEQVAGVRYLAADVLDLDAVKAALKAESPSHLIHAAGILSNGLIGSSDSTRDKLAREVKTKGLLNVIAATQGSLKKVLALGSFAGRFGNPGQTSYAAGNALMSAIVGELKGSLLGIAAEFGPWSESQMAASIPAFRKEEMLRQGASFVSNERGVEAILEDLSRSEGGILVHGRELPAERLRRLRHLSLSLESQPFLKDHQIPVNGESIPVWPLASATDAIFSTAGLEAPFEMNDLRLFQGVVVDPLAELSVRIKGRLAEIFLKKDKADEAKLSYRGRLLSGSHAFDFPALSKESLMPSLPLSEFYEKVTFHGPMLQGIAAIEHMEAGKIRGRVRTSRPSDWLALESAHSQAHWAFDPLAFDSAMQLAAYASFVNYNRLGTPLGFSRLLLLRPFPEGEELLVEAHFPPEDKDIQESDLYFWTLKGEPLAAVLGLRADMPRQFEAGAEVEAGAEARIAEAREAPLAFVPKPEWTDPSQWKGYKDLALRLQALPMIGLSNPYFDLHEGTARNTSIIGGREVINYSSYNYIGLSGDERVIKEVTEAIEKYGTSVSASRIASGERPFHRDLERELALAHGAEDALVMPGGHATNVNTLGFLFGPKDLILHDELIHDSCLQGIKLSGAARRAFKHEDLADLERQLKELRPHYEKVLILIEGVYSMDGDICDLPGYIALKKTYACLLMVDEAHSFGTVGAHGRGVGEYYGMDDEKSEARKRYGVLRSDVDIWMGTMSKSLASMGGWIAGRKELITYMRYGAGGFVFAAGIPPALGQAALSSLRLMQKEPERLTALRHNCKRFYELLVERGIDVGPARGESPVIPVITGDSMWALKLSQRLLELGDQEHLKIHGESAQGINAKPIVFPAVSNETARLRFFMTNMHTEEQLRYTADAIRWILDDIKSEAKAKS